ncbi:GntR family transcriptional regulator [Micromonospora inyonensis]|uniref:GntR family transcriptional regulator n=1 Tax=Micromonospora inyonensis TaxID=47866 RepID=A0A1C6R974_9ACTN|nr:GntR family transcriptional regulator [Micromonospora inyonensis]SCL13505.1 GntR family transcriptional regulator [Micromonospora inyonensis]
MRIDPRSHTPIYIQLADLLREKIESGEFAPGSTLPSELQLSQEHQIGRESVRMAVALLRSEGLIRTSRGRGTWVREALQREHIELTPGSSAIARMPSSRERREMDLDEGVPVIEIRGPKGEVYVLPGDQTELIRP